MNMIRSFLCLLLLLFPLRTLASSQSNKENAEKRIASCYATDLSGKGCTPQSLQKDGTILLSSFKAGDTSVLASLMRVNALSVGLRSLDTKFFAQAMLNDLDGFLSALSSTQDAKDTWRNAEVVGSACDCPGIDLASLMRSERNSEMCSMNQRHSPSPSNVGRDLEDTNATLIFTYFPPNTFQGRAGDFMVQWYSSVLYGLEEKPLWPPNPKQVTYRFTWMRSFHDQVSITMDVQPKGDGQLGLHIFHRVPQQLESSAQSLSKEQVGRVVSLIEGANFWKMTTEGEGPQGMDGAEWVLEGVQDGQYHMVTRWDASGTPFGKALLELLQLSNYNPPKSEIY